MLSWETEARRKGILTFSVCSRANKGEETEIIKKSVCYTVKTVKYQREQFETSL